MKYYIPNDSAAVNDPCFYFMILDEEKPMDFVDVWINASTLTEATKLVKKVIGNRVINRNHLSLLFSNAAMAGNENNYLEFFPLEELSQEPAEQICVRCNKPVVENKDHYEVFEKMHWSCFHYEYEHTGDPDKACSDTSCPLWQNEVLKAALENVGVDSELVIAEAIEKRCEQAVK